MGMAKALTACIVDREGRILRDAKRRLVGASHHGVGQSLGLGSVSHDFRVIMKSTGHSLKRLAYVRQASFLAGRVLCLRTHASATAYFPPERPLFIQICIAETFTRGVIEVRRARLGCVVV